MYGWVQLASSLGSFHTRITSLYITSVYKKIKLKKGDLRPLVGSHGTAGGQSFKIFKYMNMLSMCYTTYLCETIQPATHQLTAAIQQRHPSQ